MTLLPSHHPIVVEHDFCSRGAGIHDERDRKRGLRGAVRALGGAAYSSRAAPSVPTKENTTGARAHAPSRSCRCAKALTETHPGVKLGTAKTNSA